VPAQSKLSVPPHGTESGHRGEDQRRGASKQPTAGGTGHDSSFLPLQQKQNQRRCTEPVPQTEGARRKQRGLRATHGCFVRAIKPWQQSPGRAASGTRTREAGTWLQLEAVIFSIPPTPPYFWSRYNWTASLANAPAEFSESKQHIPRDPKCLCDSAGRERRGGSKSHPRG